MNIVVNSNIKDLRTARAGRGGLVRGNPSEISPLLIPGVVAGVTTKGISVTANTGKGYAGIMATYTAKARYVKSTFHTVRCNSTSMVLTNNARKTIYPVNVTNFTDLATLDADRSPLHTSVPFSGSEKNFIVNRNTNIIILRRLRRTGGEGTGVLTRIIKCNTATSTFRVASPTRSKDNTTHTVRGTVGRTNITPTRMSCVGTRKAKARRGSLFRAETVGLTFGSTTGSMGVGSAGSVINRLLNTTKTIRFVMYMGSVLSKFVRRAIKAARARRRLSLGCVVNTPTGRRIHCTVDGSLKFKKRGKALLMGGCRRS